VGKQAFEEIVTFFLDLLTQCHSLKTILGSIRAPTTEKQEEDRWTRTRPRHVTSGTFRISGRMCYKHIFGCHK
jgi:hypothetical protein